MKKIIAVLVSTLAFAAASQAQTQSPSTEIRESTDPAKVAEVERRAAELQASQQSQGTGASSGSSDSASDRHGMKGRKHHGARSGQESGKSGASGSGSR
ncbi:MAG TPA: hypothetical protein VIM12_21110 [Noviherbaspirillum sp.]